MLDVDGVLINGRPSDGKSWTATLREDTGVDPEQLQDVFFRPHWADIVIGRKGIVETLDRCLPKMGGMITTDRFLRYWFENDARIDSQVLNDCKVLRRTGMRVFLATNQEHLRARYIMRDLGLGLHVDGIVYSAQLGAKKPDCAFFEAAAAASGLCADRLILVDDTVSNIEGAKAAGWDGRLWTRVRSLSDLLRDEPA